MNLRAAVAKFRKRKRKAKETYLAGQLVRHEGLRLYPYRCTKGKLTIGVGRNIEDNGINREEALFMLENDIERSRKELENNLPWFSKLNEVRQDVLINMCFNMGITALLEFKKTIEYIEAGDFDSASVEMLDSKWAREDVGESRSSELSQQMKTGVR